MRACKHPNCPIIGHPLGCTHFRFSISWVLTTYGLTHVHVVFILFFLRHKRRKMTFSWFGVGSHETTKKHRPSTSSLFLEWSWNRWPFFWESTPIWSISITSQPETSTPKCHSKAKPLNRYDLRLSKAGRNRKRISSPRLGCQTRYVASTSSAAYILDFLCRIITTCVSASLNTHSLPDLHYDSNGNLLGRYGIQLQRRQKVICMMSYG